MPAAEHNVQIEQWLGQWGWLGVFVLVLGEQLGLPLPTLPILVLAGMLAGQHASWGGLEWLAATVASLLGGGIWFLIGRSHGRRVLRLLCRISLSPDACVRQTEVSFEKRGPATLVVARFLPGLSLLAPPLAGGIGMPAATFLRFHGTGAALYAALGIAGGELFYEPLESILRWMADNGGRTAALVAAAFALWLLRRYWQRRLSRAADIARITPAELARALLSDAPPLVIDARSELAREQDGEGIAAAIAIDWDDAGALAALPRVDRIVTFCSCPNDASAVALARRLRAAGYTGVAVLVGGLDAWRGLEQLKTVES